MLSRPPPPRGYKYNPVNGKLEKKPKGVRTVGRRHNRKRKRRKTGGNIKLQKIRKLVKKLTSKKSLGKLFLSSYLK